MRSAGFELDPDARRPGAWINEQAIPVDLLMPEALAGEGVGDPATVSASAAFPAEDLLTPI